MITARHIFESILGASTDDPVLFFLLIFFFTHHLSLLLTPVTYANSENTRASRVAVLGPAVVFP